MAKSKLNPEIVNMLAQKIGLSESTVKKNIYLLRKDYANCSPNALAQIFARSKGYSVIRKLSKEDRNTLPNVEFTKPTIKIKQKRSKKKEKQLNIIEYETNDYFKKGHIEEINKAYSNGCYTSVHILARKIIENLIREILSKKFPPTKKANKELYFDISQKRFKDFGVILRNLYDKRNDFEPDKIKIVQRLYQKTKGFKDDSNDATHSWYHLINKKKEIDDLNIQLIIELIKKLEK